MKRMIALCMSVVLMIALICMGGCADFAFNPIGTWHYTEHSFYLDNKLLEQETLENTPLMKDISLVFGKSGTGYVDTGTKDKINFTYEYDDKEVSVDLSPNSSSPKSNVVKYGVSDDRSELIRVFEQEVKDEQGKTVMYKEVYIYKK